MSEDQPTLLDEPTDEVVLVDLSSLAHMIYHVSASEPDPDHTAKTVVSRIHALAQGVEHVGICADSGRSFRHDLSPDYKANRPERDEVLQHQIALIREQLAADGFPVFMEPGFEADDLLAALCTAARCAGHPVLIVSGDKDLLALVQGDAPAVRVKSVQTGAVLDREAVAIKFGIMPEQVVDYLSLVGDASDNVAGAKGIGAKRAADLLKTFGTLDDLYSIIDAGQAATSLTPAIRQSLLDFRARLPVVRALITLRTDAPVDYNALIKPRPIPPMASEGEPVIETEPVDDIAYAMGPDDGVRVSELTVERLSGGSVTVEAGEYVEVSTPGGAIAQPEKPTQIARRPMQDVDVEAVPYNRRLEPRNTSEAITVAKDMFTARVFGAGSPQAALAQIMAGREMGIPAVTSMRTIQIIDGHLQMTAQLIVALVLKSGFAKYFRVTERTNEAATFETQRGDDPPVVLRFTIEDGRRAWSKDEVKWAASGWGKNPADMCVARASSKLARLVYPDICANVYTPEEIYEMKESSRG
jgi:5'-3' exonuclease